MEQNETKGKPVCLVNSNLTMTIDENGMPSMSFSTSWLLGLIGAGAYYIKRLFTRTFYVLDGELEEGVTLKDVDSFGTSLTFAFLRQIQSLTNEFCAHGEPLKGTEQDVKDLLVRLDDYMRRLMKFDTPYDLEQGDINDFFIKKLMGVPVV